jgi:hypothetical protein
MTTYIPSIREFLEVHPLGAQKIYELCEQYGIDLDSPWPPDFPKKDTQPAELADLPVLRSLWPDSHRAGPNAIFRSALFPSLNFQEGRPFLKGEKIYSVDSITVFFTGERFDQSDLDVYLEILHLAGKHPVGTEVTFSAHSLLKALKRDTGYSQHQWLHQVLIRLRSGTVEITDHTIRYFGGLIEGGIKHELTKFYTVSINPKLAAFFQYGLWSKIDNGQRQTFGRSMTVKALHAYYSTHAAPGPHKFDTLAGIVGLSGKNHRDVKARIIKAHKALKDAGFIADFEVIGDTIKADIKPTPSQVRHIAKKIVSKSNSSFRGLKSEK